jgi:hypothetical protein
MRVATAQMRRTLVALALLTALAGVPSAALAAVNPTITDGGSAYWVARVNGTGFSPSSWAFVRVFDNGVVSADGWVRTAPEFCYLGFICFPGTGGDFSFEANVNGCPGPRSAQAYDWGSGTWATEISLDCA